MQLIEDLRRQQAVEQSYFRQHLISEDTRRLTQLLDLAASHDEISAFVAAGMKLGWTTDDRRTHELRSTLEPLLVAVYTLLRSDAALSDRTLLDQQITELWQAFDNERMDRLVGCLSRVPRPTDISS